MFDNDGDGAWTFGVAGDDLHVEDPATHPGAIREGTHDDGLDPLVLDYDGSLDQPPTVLLIMWLRISAGVNQVWSI